MDAFPRGEYINLPLPPLQSVTHLKYYGTDNTEYTMDAADYFVDDKNEPGRLVLAYGKTWPSITLRPANGVVVQFTAGYGDAAANVPQKAKQAMLLLLGFWYENRETITTGTISNEIEFTVSALLWQDKVVCF